MRLYRFCLESILLGSGKQYCDLVCSCSCGRKSGFSPFFLRVAFDAQGRHASKIVTIVMMNAAQEQTKTSVPAKANVADFPSSFPKIENDDILQCSKDLRISDWWH